LSLKIQHKRVPTDGLDEVYARLLTNQGALIRERIMAAENGHLDSETLAVLKAVFDEARRSLPPHRQTQEFLSELAARILKLAGQRRLDSAELRVRALMEAASPTLGIHK